MFDPVTMLFVHKVYIGEPWGLLLPHARGLVSQWLWHKRLQRSRHGPSLVPSTPPVPQAATMPVPCSRPPIGRYQERLARPVPWLVWFARTTLPVPIILVDLVGLPRP